MCMVNFFCSGEALVRGRLVVRLFCFGWFFVAILGPLMKQHFWVPITISLEALVHSRGRSTERTPGIISSTPRAPPILL